MGREREGRREILAQGKVSIWFGLDQWFSTRGISCPPGNTGQCLETFRVIIPGVAMLLTSRGWSPGMLLNIPQFTGQPYNEGLFGT